MVNQLNLRLLSAYRYASQAAGGVVIVIGLLVLAGWLFDVPELTGVIPGLATMKANTALAFVLAGASLWLTHPGDGNHWRDLISKGCALGAASIGLITVCEYLFRRDLGIDQLLIQDTLSPGAVFPGRMSPITALNLSLCGLALFLLDRRPLRWLGELLGIGVLLISILALIGYAYGVPSLYDFSPFSSIAVNTAFSFSLTTLGILLARPEQGLMKIFSSDHLGGVIARRLMPAALLFPILLGWILLTGQRMGLYDSTFRLVLSAVSIVIVFSVLILWNASLLRDVDLVRQETQMKLRASREAEVALLQAKLELEAANKELEAFSYSVSHDLRSPLRSIDGYSRAVLEDYGELLPVEGRTFLEKVRNSASRMGELIDDLLKLSQVTRAEFRTVPVDLTRLAERILTELQQNHPERKVWYRVPPNLNAHGDSRLLQVVLENLLNNAWKYTSKHEQAEIEFGSLQEGDKTIYFVRDNGAGFEMDYADKLFGAFQRLHTTTEFPGTGIGLATVQRIIHRHGGRVWAEGAVNEGATFYFTLPTLDRVEARPESRGDTSIIQRAKEII
jgi:signal transduction histidine kinase